MEKSNPGINREMTWTTGPTYPGGPVPEPPPPPPQTQQATLANLLPVSRVILAALRPFPDAYRAVLTALDALKFPGPLEDPSPPDWAPRLV